MQSVPAFAAGYAGLVAARTLPATSDELIVLLLPMDDAATGGQGVPRELVEEVKNLLVLFFRGLPLAVLARHSVVPFAGPPSMSALLAGLENCAWIPAKARVVVGMSLLPFRRADTEGAEGTSADPEADKENVTLGIKLSTIEIDGQKVTRNLIGISLAGAKVDGAGQTETAGAQESEATEKNQESKGTENHPSFLEACKLGIRSICKVLGMAEWLVAVNSESELARSRT